MKKKNPRIGSSLDDFLETEETLGETTTVALKRVLAYQLQQAMDEQGLSKTRMSKMMRTSRSALDRLLDPENSSVTLQTIDKAARVIGKRIRVDLVNVRKTGTRA